VFLGRGASISKVGVYDFCTQRQLSVNSYQLSVINLNHNGRIKVREIKPIFYGLLSNFKC